MVSLGAGVTVGMNPFNLSKTNRASTCKKLIAKVKRNLVCSLKQHLKELEIPTASLNPIMVDGTGMCGACRVTVGGEVKFACVDGPEFDGHEVNFDEAMKRQQMYKTEEGTQLY